MFINILLYITISYYPTVLIHGIGGDSSDLVDIQNYLLSKKIVVHNLEIGNGKLDSIFWNINKQCQVFGQNIENFNITAPKINLLGVSQGGLIARCYLERYSHLIKPVHSLITYGSPHMGIYSNWIELKSLEYWKNPFKYSEYLIDNKFLKYINNEIDNPDYNTFKKNVISLDKFLVVWSSIDTVITPVESSKLEFYNITEANANYNLNIIPLRSSKTYINDEFGLKTLDRNKKLYIEQFDCPHEQFKHPSCFQKKFSNHIDTLIDLTISML